jgi:type IV secretory pathway TrbF-like protein
VRRALAIVGLLLLLAACGAGAWLAARPQVAPFVVAGAQDLQIQALRRGEWKISYRVAETQPAWHEALGRELERQVGRQSIWGATTD